VRAFIDLATLLLIDHTLTKLLDFGTISGDEKDRETAIRALMGVGDWINKREIAEYAAREGGAQ
jgi:hypothetical protein